MSDQTKTGVFYRISYAQKEMLTKIAKKEERTLQAVFNRAMREYIERNHGVQFITSDEHDELLQA
jgi:predicted transcriptional regulator